MSHITASSSPTEETKPHGTKDQSYRFPPRRPPQLALALVRRRRNSRKLLHEDQHPQNPHGEAEARRRLVDRHRARRQQREDQDLTARPGIVIGKKAQEVEKSRRRSELTGKEILLDIQEVRKAEIEAQLVAENVALQLERRIAFRRAMKKAVQMAMALGAEGIKIQSPAASAAPTSPAASGSARAASRCTRCATTSTTASRGPHRLRQDRRQMLDLQGRGSDPARNSAPRQRLRLTKGSDSCSHPPKSSTASSRRAPRARQGRQRRSRSAIRPAVPRPAAT